MIHLLLAATPSDAQLDVMRFLGFYLAAVSIVLTGLVAYVVVLFVRLRIYESQAHEVSPGGD